MFKPKQKTIYTLSAQEREKVQSVLKRLEQASEELVASRAILTSVLQAVVQTRAIRAAPGNEIEFSFDEFKFREVPVKNQNSAEFPG